MSKETPADRVRRAFAESRSVRHKFTVEVELAALDARNDADSYVTIEDAVRQAVETIQGVRSIEVYSD